MKLSIHTDIVEYVQIDNTYTNDELELIMFELDFLNKNNCFLSPEHTGSAVDSSNNYKKHNKAVFLDGVYQNRNTSPTLRLNRKLFDVSLPLEELPKAFRTFKFATKDTTLISYYENNDYYKEHFDDSLLTMFTYIYKQPICFTGGDLILEKEVVCPSVFNRTYIFPGFISHEVTPITMPDEHMGKGNGRYCISNFLNFR